LKNKKEEEREAKNEDKLEVSGVIMRNTGGLMMSGELKKT